MPPRGDRKTSPVWGRPPHRPGCPGQEAGPQQGPPPAGPAAGDDGQRSLGGYIRACSLPTPPGRGPAASCSRQPQARGGRDVRRASGERRPRGCPSGHVTGEPLARRLGMLAPLGAVAKPPRICRPKVSWAPWGVHGSVTFLGVDMGSLLGSGTLVLSLVKHRAGHPGSRAQVPGHSLGPLLPPNPR